MQPAALRIRGLTAQQRKLFQSRLRVQQSVVHARTLTSGTYRVPKPFNEPDVSHNCGDSYRIVY